MTKGSLDVQFTCIQRDSLGACTQPQLVIAASGTSSSGVSVLCADVCYPKAGCGMYAQCLVFNHFMVLMVQIMDL
jgi:hypothetical protein